MTSTISTSPGWRPSRQDTIDPVAVLQGQAGPRHAGLRLRRLLRSRWSTVLPIYDGKWVGIPFDIPIFITMYRKDILEKHGIKPPTKFDEFTAAVKQITEAEKANGIFGTGLQAKSGHYSLECDWTQAVWGHGGSIFGTDKKFKGNDEQGITRPAVVSGDAEERAGAVDRTRPGTASSR